ncbi:hypothetical protein O0L34_g10641 [Tuta absoluta]|nr:hypothetical protein O0L34_g10641 [Tuta absoluta]
MGKDDKEDSGFGFKDKAKAVETLRLLEEHDPNYRRLTVRGLLGRAKRVLSMTKAEEKIKNIKEAMEVFENWLADLEKNKTDKKDDKKKESSKESKKSNDKKEDSDSDVEMEEKPKEKKESKEVQDKVQGLGFKDKAAAEATLKELEGRDPEYQSLAIKGLIKSANRVLTCTKDETKLANIKEAIGVLEKFLDDFDSQHLMRQNNPYLALGIARTALKLSSDATEQQKAFIAAYASVNGEYKRLRTVQEKEDGKTWDIVRNTALKELKEKYADAKLFEKDEPTKEHLEMLLWAYSPEASKVKKVIDETKEEVEDKRESRKRKSSANESESPSKKHKDD